MGGGMNPTRQRKERKHKRERRQTARYCTSVSSTARESIFQTGRATTLVMCLSSVLSSVRVDTVDLDDRRALGKVGGDDDLG